MEQKINYQYTYFIHPFIIEENKYKEYIIKMFKDKNIRLKIFEKEKDFKQANLNLPFIADLSIKLGYYGLLNKIVLDKNKMVDILWK